MEFNNVFRIQFVHVNFVLSSNFHYILSFIYFPCHFYYIFQASCLIKIAFGHQLDETPAENAMFLQ